jgi:hypothetical protein
VHLGAKIDPQSFNTLKPLVGFKFNITHHLTSILKPLKQKSTFNYLIKHPYGMVGWWEGGLFWK